VPSESGVVLRERDVDEPGQAARVEEVEDEDPDAHLGVSAASQQRQLVRRLDGSGRRESERT